MTSESEVHACLGELLDYARRRSLEYLGSLPQRRVIAAASSEELRRLLGSPLPEDGDPAPAVIRTLADAAESGTVVSSGPRYFGFVIGGNLPAAHAADWLVSTWDQNSAVFALSPLVAVIEEITAGWLRDIAGLPAGMSVGFVTGCQLASFTGLAAARHRVLQSAGWNVEADGLFGAAADRCDHRRRSTLHDRHGSAPPRSRRGEVAACCHRWPGTDARRRAQGSVAGD